MEDYAKKIGIRFLVEEYLKNGRGSKVCRFLGKDLVISPFGDIYPCPMLPEYTIGNVTKTPLDKVICDKSIGVRVKRISNLCSRKELPVCSECCVEKVALVNSTSYLKTK
jgi:radical SAM protein with 4Fe4S-binding SPASM domain